MSIVPSFRYDKKEDFSKWSEKAKEKLAELLMLPNECCEDEFKIISKKSFDGYKRIDFEFQSEPGYFVSSSFLIPVDCTGKIPTVECIAFFRSIQGIPRRCNLPVSDLPAAFCF